MKKITRNLFIDDYAIGEIRGLKKVMNQPQKYSNNPVMVREHPWEENLISLYGTVIYDENKKLFKMWYLSRLDKDRKGVVKVNGHEKPSNSTMFCYAISKDGIHWKKPDLGMVNFEGSTHNNILPLGKNDVEGICVLYEPDALRPEWRYKALWEDHTAGLAKKKEDGLVIGAGPEDGIFVAFSPDGIDWRHYEKNPVLPVYSDTGQQVLWDERIGKYVAYGRLGTGRRVIARSESPDFINWSKPELVFETDDADDFGTQFYGMGVSIYEGQYIGMPWVFRQRFLDTRTEGNDDRIHVQLATSRDGIKWQRTGGRLPFIPNGPPDAWDGGIIYTATKPVVLDERILIYYIGTSWVHRQGEDTTRPSGIGVAMLRRDGFVSLDAGKEEGNLLTREFQVTRGKFHLNIDASHGEAYVRICDSISCNPLENYAPSCTISGDSLNVEVRWENKELDALKGKTIRFRIYLRNAKLYSYWYS